MGAAGGVASRVTAGPSPRRVGAGAARWVRSVARGLAGSGGTLRTGPGASLVGGGTGAGTPG